MAAPRFLQRLRRRLPGLLVLLLALVAFAVLCRYFLYPFLGPDRPADSPVLVIEGWVSDSALQAAVDWAGAHGVRSLWLTGGPIETGSWLAPWHSWPEMTLARLEAIGAADRFEVRAFPAPPTRKDRTLASAVALRDALSPDLPPALTLATESPHLRRSALLFRRAFSDATQIGTLPLPPLDFDQTDWYRCSSGVRSLLSESIAWLYAVFLTPAPPPPPAAAQAAP
ncbi:MAG: hypothetical protein IK066_00740 [Kiritimatiellae bacterium]|nr:hypothetical protein [Kiritimatiellia bacterium]